MLAGPPDTGECRVEQPADGSCDALRLEAESRGVTPWYRDGGCVYDGRRVATSSQATSALCTAHCLSDSRCLYWTFNFPSSTCTLYDSADRTCSTSYAPSNLSPEDCFPSAPADTGKGQDLKHKPEMFKIFLQKLKLSFRSPNPWWRQYRYLGRAVAPIPPRLPPPRPPS